MSDINMDKRMGVSLGQGYVTFATSEAAEKASKYMNNGMGLA